ncbi:hypothetical protein [Pelagibius sp.]|uniref:hypothetical protein n=1 Tax=Pelagibius sp. TaxID=1931238 RepID=UPI00260DEC9B|nr:hypothetical protein [Pelagibius sp.]
MASGHPARRNNGSTAEGFLVRCGKVRFSGERTIWFHGADRNAFEAVEAAVRTLADRFPRLDFLFTAADPGVRGWLAARFPWAIVLPPPLPLALCASRYLINLNVRAVVLLGSADRLDRFVLRAALRRAAPVVLADLGAGGGAERASSRTLKADDLDGVQHCLVASQAAEASLLESGLSAERVTLPGAEPEARREAFLGVVTPLLGQDLKLMRSAQRPLRRRLEQAALRGMENPRFRAWLAAKVERLDTLDRLRERLGNPETILCLGNGPSSEAPEVGQVRFDSLFRVNHVWHTRGFLTAPDMVFTGAKATLAAIRAPIFGLQSIKSEGRLLVTRFLRPGRGRTSYATIERFDLYLSEPRWQGIRPTNGAAMLATAVALKPARLVISGIDLFSHPDGTYPGDSKTPNAYSPGHDADSELALLLEALDLYEGELVILSPALKARWEEHCAARLDAEEALADGKPPPAALGAEPR